MRVDYFFVVCSWCGAGRRTALAALCAWVVCMGIPVSAAAEEPSAHNYDPYAFNEPILELPGNATTRTHTIEPLVAPLSIETAAANTNVHYYIKLQALPGCDTAAGSIGPDFVIPDCDMLDVFVKGGETVKLKAPLGEYIIKYAAGKDWYGYQYLFGPKGGYHRAENSMVFERDGGKIHGYSIKLYKVQGGNLEMERVDLMDF